MIELTEPESRDGPMRLTWSWQVTFERITHLLLLPPHRLPLTPERVQFAGSAILQDLMEAERTNTPDRPQKRAHWSIEVIYYLC